MGLGFGIVFFLALGVSFRGLGLVVGTHFVRFCLSFWVGWGVWGLGLVAGPHFVEFLSRFGFGIGVWSRFVKFRQVSARFGRFRIVL